MAGKCVIAAIDLHHKDSDRIIAEEALAISKLHKAELHLVYVIPDQQAGYVQAYIPAEMREQATKDANNSLIAFGSSLDAGEVPVKTHILRGIIYQEIIKFSSRLKASMIVIGANKPSFSDFFLGPNSARVARHTECSVMIVRPERGLTSHD